MTTNLYTESPTNGNFAAPLRILIYSRVSSPQQAHTGHSIDAQPEALRAYSKAQGWRVIDEMLTWAKPAGTQTGWASRP